jgi:hypothetical protein
LDIAQKKSRLKLNWDGFLKIINVLYEDKLS